MTVCTTIDSPLGDLLLVGERSATAPGGTALASLSVPGQKGGATAQDDWTVGSGAFAVIAAQPRAYFTGELTRFSVEYAGHAEHVTGGTPFRQRVWRALEDIPYGGTLRYGEIAARIGAPRAAVRAGGAAIGANPLLVVRPCHRVIGAGGALAGYAGGLERKQRLLDLEAARRGV